MSAPDSGFPLAWPIGWARKAGAYRPRAKFGTGHGTSYTLAMNALHDEMRKLGGKEMVISTNLPLRVDGVLRANAGEPSDPGVAIYFRLKGERRVLAADKFDRVADNIMAIAKHIEAIRGQVRWGVGSLEQAFGGYLALTAMPAVQRWFEVLEVDEGASMEACEAAHEKLIRRHHPDHGGSHARAADINSALDEARRERSV